MRDFAENVDLVFVGHIVSTKRDYRHDGPDQEDPDRIVIVHDGIEFQIETILSGGADSGKTVTIAHPGLLTVDGDNEPAEQLIEAEPTSIVRRGIEGASVAKGVPRPSYLVFAVRRKFADGEAYVFAGPGSVAPIAKDDNLVESPGFAPFDLLELDAARWGTDITVEEIQKWIDEGPPPSPDPPADQLPDADTPRG